MTLRTCWRCRSRFPAARAAGLLTGALWGLLVATSLPAQPGKAKKGVEPEKITGKIAEIEKKGKSVTLTIEKEDGGSLEILVTPKLKAFAVTAKGDAEFFQPQTWVSSEALVMANKELFGRRFTVHLGSAPPPGLKQDPGSAEVYHFCGQIIAADDESLTVKLGNAGRTQKIHFEQGASLEITVNTPDMDLITEGAAVELEGTARGAKFLPTRVTVLLENPLTAAEVLAAAQDKKSAKAKPSAKNKSKASRDKDDDDATGEDEDDPLGVFGKKKGAEKNQPKEAAGDSGGATDGARSEN